jgi:hypothetical protein
MSRKLAEQRCTCENHEEKEEDTHRGGYGILKPHVLYR